MSIALYTLKRETKEKRFVMHQTKNFGLSIVSFIIRTSSPHH
jgi:hypothetical protein